MLKTIEGVYQDGRIQLSTPPEGVSDRAQVLVTFLEPGGVTPEKLHQLIDQLATIAGIEQGLEAVNAEQTRSIEAFAQEMSSKYDISG